MTAVDHVGDDPAEHSRRVRELAQGVSPGAVAAALISPDRERFLAEYDRLLLEARASLDLGPVLEMVDSWRGLAALQVDPERYRQHLLVAAELGAGAPVPVDETIEQLRARIGG